MKDTVFGALALQLFKDAQIPGAALDEAVQFRDRALALSDGRLVINEAPPPEELQADAPAGKGAAEAGQA